MREITYSSDIVIENQGLLNGLLICCKQIWLPNRGIIDALLAAAEDCEKTSAPSPVDASDLRKKISADKRREKILQWESANKTLFDEKILNRLPPSVEGEEEHSIEDLSFEDVWKDCDPGVTTRLSLHCHLAIRNTLPGLAFFESVSVTEPPRDVVMAAKILSVNIPMLKTMPLEEVLEKREAAKEKGIDEFWEMIDYYNDLASEKASIDKVQEDILKWNRENMELRVSALATAGMATLCFVNPVFLSGAALTGFHFLSKANVRWAERNLALNKGAKFVASISRDQGRRGRSM